jgi:Calcineurin-like phosphoesterase
MHHHHHNHNHTHTHNHHRRRQDVWICMVTSGIVSLLMAVFLLPKSSFTIGDNVDGSTSSGRRHYDSFPSTWRLEFQEGNTAAAAAAAVTSTAKFKILQLTDIHLGEAANTDWGPRQDTKTWHLLDRVIRMEKPDLIVLSGDQLTANNVDANATVYYKLLGQHLSYYGVPWAMVCGNIVVCI